MGDAFVRVRFEGIKSDLPCRVTELVLRDGQTNEWEEINGE
jgi:hypothetical protein